MQVDSATYIYIYICHHDEQCVPCRREEESWNQTRKKKKRVVHSVHVFPEIEPVATTRERRGAPLSRYLP